MPLPQVLTPTNPLTHIHTHTKKKLLERNVLKAKKMAQQIAMLAIQAWKPEFCPQNLHTGEGENMLHKIVL